MSDSQHDFNRTLTWVSIGHGLLIGTVLGLSMIQGCQKTDIPSGPVELFVDIPADLSGPEGGRDDTSEPEKPAPKPKEKPAQPPAQEADFPTAASKTKPAPRKPEAAKAPEKTAGGVKVSKKLIRLPATTTRKSKLTASEIQNLLNRGAKPGKSSLSDADLRRLLNSDTRFGDGAPISREFALIEQIRQALYRAWDQPTQLGVAGLVTRVEITFAPDGGIVTSRILSSSGNATMDTSVMSAVRSVRRIPGLPADFLAAHRRIPVAFELTGND